MKRCPKCNRTYSTDTQKFCTHDGGLLFAEEPDDLGQTVQFDSSKVRDAVPKPTTRDLPAEQAAAFDPEATVVSRAVSDGTQQVKSRDTGDLQPPNQTQYYGAPPPSVQPTGPVSPPPAPPPAAAPPAPTSAPLPPPQPSAALPPTQVVNSAPVVAPSIPMPAPPAAAATQVSQPLPPAAPRKKSKLPIILGILAVLIIFFVGAAAVAGYFLWWKPRQEAQARERVVITEPSQPSSSLPTTTATPSEASVPSTEPPPYNPPADAVQFVNSESDLSGRLAENFVAFSFYYPNRWEKDPKAGTGTSANFVEVHRQLDQNSPQESMAVSWYVQGEDSFQDLASKKSTQLEKSIGQYRKLSEGPTKIGTYEGYELRFEGQTQRADQSEMSIWGRVVWLPPSQGDKKGVALLMYSTSLTPDVRSIDDVGVKGELPMLLESFRFGK